MDDVHRDAAIQRFEYTYEMCWKMMHRHLTWARVADVEKMGRRELFREAARSALIDDPVRWMRHHEARNATSHNYDERNAVKIFQHIRSFVDDAEGLLAELKDRHA